MRDGMGNRNGYTLLELIIVAVIVGIMVTIATSNLFSWLDHSAAVNFRQEFLARSNEARTRAMASNRQQRMVVDIDNSVVLLQSGNAGTNSAAWTQTGNRLAGTRGAGIRQIVFDNGTTLTASTASFIYNPGGQVLFQDNNSLVYPMGHARFHMASANPTEQATIRLYGFTSKAGLENGWN